VTRAVGTIVLALLTGCGEVVLAAATITDWSSVGAHALLFAFLAGPLLFLALMAWRRRSHATRTKVLFAVALLCALGGLSALGWRAYRFHTVPEAKFERSDVGLAVPLVQWGAILLVWLWLLVVEAREKRAASAPGAPNVTK
jgi:hypothetical protein